MAVAGVDRATVELPAAAPVVSYANNGYRVERVGQRASITVDAGPLESHAGFSLPPLEGLRQTPVARLARAVSAGSQTRYEAVSRLLAWVAANVHYRLDRDLDQSPDAVLARRDAYCTGYARLSVALLTAAGIEAREVAGVLLEATGEAPAGFHRWIEVFYPDRGWSFSDPMASHHYVPAVYLPLTSERVSVGLPHEIRLVGREDRLWPVDRYDTATGGIWARKNLPRQLGGTVRIEVDGRPQGVALLEGEGLRRRVRLAGGAATFTGVDPGSYTLRFLGTDLPRVEARLLVTDRQRLVLHVPECVPAGGSNGRETRPCVATRAGGS